METDENGGISEIPELPTEIEELSEDDSFFEDSPADPQPVLYDPVIEPTKVTRISRFEIVEEAIAAESRKETAEINDIPQVGTDKKSFFETIKSKLTTRAAKTAPVKEPEPEPEVEPVKQRSYIERKFSPEPFGAFEKEAPREKKAEVVPAISLLGRIKDIRYVSKLFTLWPLSSLFGSSEERIRADATGLTPRQRIKRYNSIHEGGYGMPKTKMAGGVTDDETAKAQQIPETETVDTLSIELAKWFGTAKKFTSRDIRTQTTVKLTPGEIRGAINHMHNAGLLLRRGVSPSTGYGLWSLSTRGLIRATRAAWRKECTT